MATNVINRQVLILASMHLVTVLSFFFMAGILEVVTGNIIDSVLAEVPLWPQEGMDTEKSALAAEPGLSFLKNLMWVFFHATMALAFPLTVLGEGSTAWFYLALPLNSLLWGYAINAFQSRRRRMPRFAPTGRT
jgi:hypothetical protein